MRHNQPVFLPMNKRWFFSVLSILAASAWAQSIKVPDFRQPSQMPATRMSAPCENCGEVRSIREINTRRPANVPSAFRTDAQTAPLGVPNLVGAVVALPVSSGSGEPFVGGVGTPEMRERFSDTTYEITVRLDNGGYTLVERRDGSRFRVGDRVRIAQGTIELVSQ